MTIHAFADESRRGRRYVLALVLAAARDRQEIVQALRSLLLPGERHFHMTKEHARRKRQALSTIATLPVEAVTFVTQIGLHGADSEEDARQRCLVALVETAVDRGVEQLVLDRRDPSQNPGDARTIARHLQKMGADRPRYRHESAAQEPLLWVPDIVAWAISSRGDWRSRATDHKHLATIVKIS